MKFGTIHLQISTNIFSVDRVDPKKGYVEGNVVACTVEINSKKSNLSIDEIHNLSTQIKKFFHTDKPKRILEVELVNDVVEKHESLSFEKEPILTKDLPKNKTRKRVTKKTLQSNTDDDFFEKLN
jgi:hypothetical protein